MRVKNVEQLRKVFPEKVDIEHVFNKFSQAINDDSEVSIHSVINLVALIVAAVPQKGALPSLPLGIPRVELV